MSGFDPRLLFYFFLTETLNNWQRPFTTGKFASTPSLLKLPNFMGIRGLKRKKKIARADVCTGILSVQNAFVENLGA